MSEAPSHTAMERPDSLPDDTPWLPLPPSLDTTDQRTFLSKKRVRNWSLVLKSRQVPSRTEHFGRHWQLLVPENSYATALQELRQYEIENCNWPPPDPDAPPAKNNLFPTVWVLIALGLFYDVTLTGVSLPGHPSVDWLALGNAHAGKILDGQWWRCVTALTLHSDWLHLLSNLLIGGVFIIRLCRDTGSGLGWSLLLASGAAGNLVNAWLQFPQHRAVGASTAIFGAVGLLAAISLIRYRHHLRPQKRWALPVAAALGLLAMLGAGGENTDLGAHLFGFLCGLIFGGASEYLTELFGRPGKGLSAALSLCGIALVIGAWYMALYGSGTA